MAESPDRSRGSRTAGVRAARRGQDPGGEALLREAVRAMQEGGPEEQRSALVRAARGLLEERRREATERVLVRLAACDPGTGEEEAELGLEALAQGITEAGATLALGGLRALEAGGRAEAAERTRAALEEAPQELSPAVYEALARDRAGREEGGAAAALLVRAARGKRRAGAPAEALELCTEAAKRDEEAPGLVRERGLALLQTDAPERALADLREWRRTERWSGEAHAACTQALWECERVEEARTGFGALAEVCRLTDARNQNVAAHEIGRRLESADPIWRTRLLPFWEAEEVWGAVASREDGARESAAGESEGRWVAVAPDTHIYRKRLSVLLAEAGYEVSTAAGPAALGESLAGAGTAPDLAILGLRPDDLGPLRALRKEPELAGMPVLGLTTLDRSGLDLEELRELGVVGLLDKTSTPEHVLFRVNGVTEPAASTRRFVRAPAFFPVDLCIAGRWQTEYATNLSVGGLGLATDSPLEANTDVTLRFCLREGQGPEVEREGRIVYCRSRPGAPPYEVGLFFHRTDDDTRRRIEEEVERLLDDRFEVTEGAPGGSD